jgi:flagellar biosynthesis GTPase FlhF
MEELRQIKAGVKPHETLLVADAMTGQEAVNIAEKFNTSVGFDGVVLTKLDGDARGGAALSIRAVTGKPIKFVGMGEKLDQSVMKDLGVGGVAVLPAEMRHFAMAKTSVMLQIHGVGPFVVMYVNPADDPSQKK